MQNRLWTKGLVVGIIMLFVGTSVLPGISGNIITDFDNFVKSNNSMKNLIPLDHIDQSQTYDSGNGICVYYPIKLAQSFVPTLKTLTRVQLKCSASPYVTGNLIISIRGDLSGDDLTSKSLPVSSIPFERGWIEFDFDDISVTPGQTYYIVWSPTSADEYKMVVWSISGPSNPYADGCIWGYSPDFGWGKEFDLDDLCFTTYGTSGGNQPVIEIEQIKGGFGISAVIKNNGTGVGTDIAWSIDVSGGIILSGSHTEGTIDELAVGASTTIKAKPRGIGRITITVQAGDAVEEATAFLLGPLVLRVQEL